MGLAVSQGGGVRDVGVRKGSWDVSPARQPRSPSALQASRVYQVQSGSAGTHWICSKETVSPALPGPASPSGGHRAVLRPFRTTRRSWTVPVTTVMVTEDQVWTDVLAMGHHPSFAGGPRLLSQGSQRPSESLSFVHGLQQGGRRDPLTTLFWMPSGDPRMGLAWPLPPGSPGLVQGTHSRQRGRSSI